MINAKHYLFQLEYVLHKKLLQILIGKVDAHLFKATTEPTKYSSTIEIKNAATSDIVVLNY